MKLIDFIRSQPSGYQALLWDYTWVSYSRISTIMAKLRKGIKPSAKEAELIIRGISRLEGRDYDVTMFEWQN
jgi:hypothetical protein